jgi:hypothetical protein
MLTKKFKIPKLNYFTYIVQIYLKLHGNFKITMFIFSKKKVRGRERGKNREKEVKVFFFLTKGIKETWLGR